MNKCKNCEEKIKDERTYCSVKCRNVFYNKNICDYKKLAEQQSGKKKYDENPKKCKHCAIDIDYKGRKNDFCSLRCSGKFYNTGRVVSDKTKEKLIIANKKYLEKIGYIYTTNCKNCNKIINKKDKIKFCSKECRESFRRKDIPEKRLYKLDCSFKFNLSDFSNEFDFELIKQYGWYKPKNRGNNLNGISRDHMYSIDEGFSKQIDPYLISHPANCKLIRQKENSTKYKKSSITLEELKTRIKNWDNKYKTHEGIV